MMRFNLRKLLCLPLLIGVFMWWARFEELERHEPQSISQPSGWSWAPRGMMLWKFEGHRWGAAVWWRGKYVRLREEDFWDDAHFDPNSGFWEGRSTPLNGPLNDLKQWLSGKL